MAHQTIITNARILTLAGPPEPRRGDTLRDLGVIERGFILIRNGRISEVGSDPLPNPVPETAEGCELIDAEGCVVMPTFVDCHTHACWGGDRFDEFEGTLAGATYLEILESGGGIMSTVRATRAATERELTDLLLLRLRRMGALGTGTVEVKSGYGLAPDSELKMLRAICAARDQTSIEVVPAFLGAHTIDPDHPRFVEQTITETLPAVARAFPGITCDAYCEKGAWSLEQCRRYFERAIELGCPIRVHADQFNALGMTRLAVELGAISVDHLEASTPADLEALAKSETIGVVLPACGFHLNDRYAPARQFIDAGGALALATNYNPGSAPTPSIPFVIALACRKLGLTPAEAITATTFNAACVLRLQHEVGSLQPGLRADLQMLDGPDERALAHEFASAGPRLVMIGGEIVFRR